MAKKQSSEPVSVESAYREALSRYSTRPYVTAIDIGYKYVNAKKTDQLSVRIHITEKRDRQRNFFSVKASR